MTERSDRLADDVDAARLDELGALQDGAVLRAAVELFTSASLTAVPELRALLDDGDADEALAHAHKLAGQALTLGVTAAGRRAREIELHLAGGEPSGLEDLLDALEIELADARRALADHQARQA